MAIEIRHIAMPVEGDRPPHQHRTLPTDEIRVIWKATEETIPAGLQSLYDHHEFVGYLRGVG